jgi:hypothetical protein
VSLRWCLRQTAIVATGVPIDPAAFAFGISGPQTHVPPGWGGGNQLAIHGTNSLSTIGTSASAGCVRLSEAALARLKPVLQARNAGRDRTT